MKFKIPSAIVTRVANKSLVLQKHAPKILHYSGIVLMGGTVVTSSMATLKLEETLDKIRSDREEITAYAIRHPEEFSTKQINRLQSYVTVKGVLRISKLYAPSLVLGVAAVACLTSSHNIMARRNAGLSAALVATERALKQYRERVVDEFGVDKDREFMFGTVDEEIEYEDSKGNKKTKTVKKAGNGASPYSRVWARDTSTEWDPEPSYNLPKLRGVQEWGTMMLNHKGHLFLNEIFDELGLDRTPAGAVVGWLSVENGGADGYVDLGIIDPVDKDGFLDFVTRGDDILLDFNVDGEIWRNI